VRRAADYADLKAQGDESRYETYIQDVKGHIVDFPYEFLIEETITVTILQPEFYVPNIVLI
jgi:hypothetical protein